MLYQAEVFWPFQQVWSPIGGADNHFADAIRKCWAEQSLWANFHQGVIPECRIAIGTECRVNGYALVPHDADFNNPVERDDEIVVHLWRCAEQSATTSLANKANDMYDAMMDR